MSTLRIAILVTLWPGPVWAGKVRGADLQRIEQTAVAMEWDATAARCDALRPMSGPDERVARAMATCAGAYINLGRVEEAGALLEAMPADTEEAASVGQTAWGILALARCDFDAAVEHYYAAAAGYEDRGQEATVPEANTALTYAYSGRPRSGLALLAPIVDAHPGHPYEAYWRLSQARLHLVADEESAARDLLRRHRAQHGQAFRQLAEMTLAAGERRPATVLALQDLEVVERLGAELGLDASAEAHAAELRRQLRADLKAAGGACAEAWQLQDPLEPEVRAAAPVVEAPAVEATPEPEGPARLVGRQIEIDQKIHFDSGSATIDPRSDEILTAVAELLRAHPEIERVRVEGHTDDVGSEAANLELSAARAAAVRSWLVEWGIASERLDSRGHGEARPLRFDQSEAARAINRRVELVVVQ